MTTAAPTSTIAQATSTTRATTTIAQTLTATATASTINTYDFSGVSQIYLVAPIIARYFS